MNLFYNSLEFLKRNKKNIAYIGLFFLFMYLSTDLSFAVGGEPPKDTVASTTIQVLQGFVGAAGALLGMLTFLVGMFLYPGWTSGSVIGLSDPLKTMWIMISNIVYFIFAFIFIWIAFMNVIGKEGDHYQLKQAIPRFIVGVIMVPFSWFLVQFVISLSSILSIAVLSLPYDTFKDSTFLSTEKLSKITFCREYVVNMGESSSGNGNSGKDSSSTESGTKKVKFPIDCKDKSNTISLKEIIDPENSESLYGIMAFYTYGVMSLDSNGKIFEKDISDNIKSVFDLGLKMIFDLLFVIIYLILMLALALVLFVRGVMLWLFAMFSPVFGLLYFFKKTGEGMGEKDAKNFNVKELINLAFVPVYVSGALAFGMLFLFVAGEGFGKYANDKTTDNITNNSVISVKDDKVTMGGMSYSFSGAFSSKNAKEGKGLITGFQGSFGTMLMQLFGLGILWMALMAAVHHSHITRAVAEPFEKFGGDIGGLIKKLPTYAPIIPTPGGMMSSTGLQQVGGAATQYYSQKSIDTGKDFMKRNNLFQSEDVNAATKSKEALNALNNLGLNKDTFERFAKALQEYSDPTKLAYSKDGRDLVQKMAELSKVDIKDLKIDNPKDIAKAVTRINNAHGNHYINEPLYGDDNVPEGDSFRRLEEFMKSGKVKPGETPTPPPINSINHTIPNTSKPNEISVNFKVGDKITPITINKTESDITKLASEFKKAGDGKFTKGQIEIELKKIFGDTDPRVGGIITELKDEFFKS